MDDQSQYSWNIRVSVPLFRYAVHQERCGDTNLFDAVLSLAERGLDGWRWEDLDVWDTFAYASPRAMVLLAPNMNLSWRSLPDSQDVISKWVAATSVAPHTEEVARNVVDMLMQLVPNYYLKPLIPAHVWLWLNERPSLPPAYMRRWSGGDFDTIWTIRGLNDIGILTSYLLLTWSEWESPGPSRFYEIRMSIREDFNGIGMGFHRAELIQRLDCILGGLDRGYELGSHLRTMKDEYGQLKRILQDVEARTPHNFIFPGLLTLTDLYRIPLHFHVCPASPVSIISHLERSTSRDEPLYLFPFHIIVFSMRSPCRLGTVAILPRYRTLVFS
jgi:hypothetical protein